MIYEFIDLETYLSRVERKHNTVIKWIRAKKPMPGVKNIWWKDNAYLIQYNKDHVPDVLKKPTKTQKELTEEKMKRYKYLMQRDRLKRRLKQPDKYWIVPESEYMSFVRHYVKCPLHEYIDNNIKLPGVECTYKMGIHYMQLKKRYDFENIPTADLNDMVNYIPEVKIPKKRKKKKGIVFEEDIQLKNERKLYSQSFSLIKKAKKL